MDDETLKGLAFQAANILRADVAAGKRTPCVIMYCDDGEPPHRMRDLEKSIIEREGPDWLNSKEKKFRVFGILRFATERIKPTAMIFANGGNFTITEKGNAACDVTPTIRRGLSAVAQTEHRVCLVAQFSETDRTCDFFDQSELEGFQKMYGEMSPELKKIAAKTSLLGRRN